MKKLLFITWSVSYGYGTERSLAYILNSMVDRYEINILLIFKKSESQIFDKKIKILDALIDYTYDCIIACNHNASSYLASYITQSPKIVWVRGDLKELDYKQLLPLTVEYT